jgi:hypothetical protein
MKVGDEVTIYYRYATKREPKSATVTKVGRKYFTADGVEFALLDGHGDNGRQMALTAERVVRLNAEREFFVAVDAWNSYGRWRNRVDQVPTEQLNAATALLNSLLPSEVKP